MQGPVARWGSWVRRGLCLALIALWLPQAAQAERGCVAQQASAFRAGFSALQAALGDAMGEPLSCEYADPGGSGDVLQDTSTGLAFWRKRTNTPTFTNGTQHWAITDAGLVTWTGDAIDPPGTPPPPPDPMSAPTSQPRVA